MYSTLSKWFLRRDGGKRKKNFLYISEWFEICLLREKEQRFVLLLDPPSAFFVSARFMVKENGMAVIFYGQD